MTLGDNERSMAVYKQRASKFWWYKFTWTGQLIRRSTKHTNKRVAEQMEAAHKTALAKGEVGIFERPVAPMLREFAHRFFSTIEVRCAGKPRTIGFYKEKYSRLLEYEPLASSRLDRIDEGLIEDYVLERRKRVAPATVNRQLATLRRALRLAHEWKLIDRVPRVRMLPGERYREFVLTKEQEILYLETTSQPLRDIAILILDTGLRIGEVLALQWADVRLTPATGSRLGYIHVRDGKSRNAQRYVSLTARVRQMLNDRRRETIGPWVFMNRLNRPYVGTHLNHIHQAIRKRLEFPTDFVIHSLRHTMLTRLGEAGVDAFTIMRIAGHSSITVSQRYVHPSPEALERAIEKLEAFQTAVSQPVVGIESGIVTRISEGDEVRNTMN
jgi:integrase